MVVHCGGNDQNSRPEQVGHLLLDTASKIKQEADAKLVVVCQILKRQMGKYLRTETQVEDFNKKVKVANDYLKTVAPEYDCIKFWRHRGLTNVATPNNQRPKM